MAQDDKIKMMAPREATAKSPTPSGQREFPGLSGEETDEYLHYLTCYIKEITQEDWQRFHELNDKCVDALAGN